MPRISDARRAERRGQILDAAWICFQRQGIHATTMDDIIRGCGLSAGAVYSYFSSKEDLIFAAVAVSLSGLGERVTPVLAARPLPPPADLVRDLAALVAGFSAREGYDLRRIALLGWAETQRNPRLREMMRERYLEFRGQLGQAAEQWRNQGLLGDEARAEEVAKTILSMILGFVAQSALIGDVDPGDLAGGVAGFGSGAAPGCGAPVPARTAHQD